MCILSVIRKNDMIRKLSRPYQRLLIVPDSHLILHVFGQRCMMNSSGKWLEEPVKGLLLDISGVLKDGDVPIPGSVKAVQTCMMNSSGKWLEEPVKGLLLDISGVLKDGDVPIPGSVKAVQTLQSAGFPFRLVTNETLKPRATILKTLQSIGYDIPEAEMFSPVPALIQILKKENLRPHILMHPRMLPEFSGISTEDPNCVVMGDAAEYFQYSALNDCFRKLMEMKNPILFSLGIGKYYMDDDGLALDLGAFCKALEYATGVTARIVGKPSSEFFLSAVADMGLQPNEVVMIGDDIGSDVGGAQACGLRGVLVRTGKYRRERDEPHATISPDGIVNNLEEAVSRLMERHYIQIVPPSANKL